MGLIAEIKPLWSTTMNNHAQLIDTFYTAFAAKDYATMKACYHDKVQFSDPVFTLRWGGACGTCVRAGQDLRVVHSQVQADDRQERSFSTGRRSLTRPFSGGLIMTTVNRFE